MEITIMKVQKRIRIGVVVAFTLLASACHTVEGIGKDLESAGDKAEEITKN
jgi:predicted small secreted protein